MEKRCVPNVFVSGQDITAPTLLIEAEYKRINPRLSFLSRWLLRWLNLEKRLYVEDWIGLTLYFENFYDSEINIQDSKPFFIVYPHQGKQRPWKLNIPYLKKKGDCCYAETDLFFKPEVAGTHMLIIQQTAGLRYADKHGVTGRKLQIFNGDWAGSFHVHSVSESRLFATVIVTLCIAIASLAVSIIQCLR